MLPALLIITENPSIRFWVKKHLDNRFFILDATEKGEALTVVLDFPLNFIILEARWTQCASELGDENGPSRHLRRFTIKRFRRNAGIQQCWSRVRAESPSVHGAENVYCQVAHKQETQSQHYS